MERDTVLIDLALQGGGSHGAFSWGVLDRLLAEKWLTIAADAFLAEHGADIGRQSTADVLLAEC